MRLARPVRRRAGDEQSCQALREIDETFVELVRANATRLLVPPTLHANADQGRLDTLAAESNHLDDPNVAAIVHFYGS